MALIEFRGVKKAFGPKVVYRDLNLDINESEVLTIIGDFAEGETVVTNTECIATSYPGFQEQLEAIREGRKGS